MRIYTRTEWNAVPPKSKLPSGLKKKGFLIHHTASGNGILSLEQEKRQQKRWQIQHMGPYTNYKGRDILHGATVFKSGRVFEGRMPWDSNNGAAYNAGYDWFGIECDGTFYYEGQYMELTQYKPLVELCAYLHRLKGFPLVFKGHKQIPGNATACPGLLLQQFLLNNKLKRDVKAFLKGQPKEDDMGLATRAEIISKGETSRTRTWIDKSANKILWINVSNLGNKNTTVRYFGWRYNGDFCKAVDVDLLPSQVNEKGKFDGNDKDAVAFFGNGSSGITMTVECIKGGPVQVEWTKTI